MLKLEFTAETPQALREAVADYLEITHGIGEVEIIPSGAVPDVDLNKATTLIDSGGAADAISLDADNNVHVGTPTVVGAPIAAVVNIAVDQVGTPWDGRIHTSNKSQKANGEWKRKPGLSDDDFNLIKAEVTAAAPVAAQTAVVVQPVAAVVPPVVTPQVVAAIGPNLNDVQEKSAQLVMSLQAQLLGPQTLTKILTQFGAVANNPVEGQPPLTTVSALTLDKYAAFVATCDAVISTAGSITAENLEGMIEVLIVRQA